jgi:hypothetical protein
MDALQIIMMMFLLGPGSSCSALPAEATQLEGQNYQKMRWLCGDHQVEAWQRQCFGTDRKDEYWTRPFMLVDSTTGNRVYLNRFAEMQAGWHVPLDETYIPKCGS